MRPVALLLRASTPADRWLMGVSAVAILTGALFSVTTPGKIAMVSRDNRPILRLALDRDSQHEVAGRLGPVVVQVEGGRVRLLEHRSPRMIGTRVGWIQGAGRAIACVPCGIVIRVEGGERSDGDAGGFDAVSE
ncbi:MAG: NusG domain II-containing protein [Magnetococcales bacterium]|nr:NusG domain II-containing protein [Magnetococcales bacterium]